MPTKITGYSAMVRMNGIDLMITVKVESKEQASYLLSEATEIPVVSLKDIHKTCTVKHPGPLSVQKMSDYQWDKRLQRRDER